MHIIYAMVAFFSSTIGAISGIGGGISSFLGIGGGPANIAVLYYFFSMEVKEAARNSLFIILCSQVVSLVTSRIPEFSSVTLILMCLGGAEGAIIGSGISAKMSDRNVEVLFRILLVVLILINVWNIIQCW